MILEMDDLPVVESAGRLGRRPSPDTPVADAYSGVRREDSAFLTSAALALGPRAVALLRGGTLPPADQLRALHAHEGPHYSMYTDCGPYDYNATCEEACFGFAPHQMDPFYCATCDEQNADPVNNPAYNWHFVGSRGSIQYMDREPDVCAGKDAWKWKIDGRCGNCQESAVFRCHDGFKRYSDNTFEPTICQGLVSCDNKLTPC